MNHIRWHDSAFPTTTTRRVRNHINHPEKERGVSDGANGFHEIMTMMRIMEFSVCVIKHY